MHPRKTTSFFLFSALVVVGSLVGCAFTTPIESFSQSKSHFSENPELIKHDQINDRDIYRVYHRAATGFVSIAIIRKDAEYRAEEFAKRQGKSFMVLGEQISHAPYILGNFPRIEIVFALVDKPKDIKEGGSTSTTDKFDLASELRKIEQMKKENLINEDEYKLLRQRALDKAKSQ